MLLRNSAKNRKKFFRLNLHFLIALLGHDTKIFTMSFLILDFYVKPIGYKKDVYSSYLVGFCEAKLSGFTVAYSSELLDFSLDIKDRELLVRMPWCKLLL